MMKYGLGVLFNTSCLLRHKVIVADASLGLAISALRCHRRNASVLAEALHLMRSVAGVASRQPIINMSLNAVLAVMENFSDNVEMQVWFMVDCVVHAGSPHRRVVALQESAVGILRGLSSTVTFGESVVTASGDVLAMKAMAHAIDNMPLQQLAYESREGERGAASLALADSCGLVACVLQLWFDSQPCSSQRPHACWADQARRAGEAGRCPCSTPTLAWRAKRGLVCATKLCIGCRCGMCLA